MARNWLKQTRNGGNGNSLPATNSATKPGDFPVGSVESRAAARALHEQRKQAGPKIEVRIVHIGGKQAGVELRPPFESAGIRIVEAYPEEAGQ